MRLAIFLCLCTCLSAGQLRIRWVYQHGKVMATGFHVERAPAPPSLAFRPIGSAVGSDRRDFVDLTAIAGVTYQYRVRAYSDGGVQLDYSPIIVGKAGVAPPNGKYGSLKVEAP